MAEKRPQRELDELLWDAAEAGDVELCKALKAEGANVNWIHPKPPNYPGRAYQWTALHVASDRGRLEVVTWLTDKDKGGADLNKKQSYGETALQHVDGRTGNGREAVQAHLKMKVGLMAVMAATKFAASKKKAGGGNAAAEATAQAVS